MLLNSPDAALRIRIFSVLLTRSGKTLVEHPDNEKRSRVHTASSAIILVTSATKSTPPEPVIFCFLLPIRTATIFAAVAPAIFEQVRFAILFKPSGCQSDQQLPCTGTANAAGHRPLESDL